jgi:hypothetical protein
MGMAAACLAIYTRQYVLGVFILAYCQVQLGEALIWRGIDTDNLFLNRIGTMLIKYTLPAHLFFLGLGVFMTTKNTVPLLAGIVFFVAVCVYYTFPSSIKSGVDENEQDVSFPAQRGCMKRECQNNDNRLQWPFKDNYYLQSFVIVIIFYMFLPIKSFVLLTSFYTLTFVVSKIMFVWSASTMWCFLSAVLAPIVVVMNYYVMRQK